MSKRSTTSAGSISPRCDTLGARQTRDSVTSYAMTGHSCIGKRGLFHHARRTVEFAALQVVCRDTHRIFRDREPSAPFPLPNAPESRSRPLRIPMAQAELHSHCSCIERETLADHGENISGHLFALATNCCKRRIWHCRGTNAFLRPPNARESRL
jgi:hypothetical protein